MKKFLGKILKSAAFIDIIISVVILIFYKLKVNRIKNKITSHREDILNQASIIEQEKQDRLKARREEIRKRDIRLLTKF